MRRFDGWEPTEETTHTYDRRGRLVRSVTTREPEWDEESQAHVLALELYESVTCDGCGGYLPETTDPANSDDYVADHPIRCHRCTAIGHQADGYRDNGQPQALRFPTHRRSERR